MSKVGDEVKLLLNSNNLSASDITKPLKEIGDGSMIAGVRNVYNFGEEEGVSKGEKTGRAEGLIMSLFSIGLLYLGPKVVKHIKEKTYEKKQHQIIGEKIKNALENTSADDNPSEIEEENL